jgi:respiratory burst oxidase
MPAKKDKEAKKPSRWAEREAYFFNQGANIAAWAIFLSMNVGMAVWGIWEFTIPNWSTESDLLRITLPIARAGGRLVTFNIAILLLTASKYSWTLIREHTVIPLGFPVDNIMPEYHRFVAWVIIISGCVVHTLPQIINYATLEIPILDNKAVWTYGDGFSTKQLLYTGSLLFFIFALFFVTTLQQVRRTTLGFRLFWYTHVFGIVAALPLLVIHGTIRGSPILFYFLIGPLGLYIGDCLARRLVYVDREATIVEQKTYEDRGEQVVKLVLHCKDFVYKPGQYAELKTPEISHFEWHPFTIASAPSEDGNGENVTFYIKAAGRWTNQLFESVSSSSEDDRETVFIRGPHGAPAQNYLAYRHLLVIGSGIGVTPLLSVWQYLVNAGSHLICEPPPEGKKRKKLELEDENETQLLDRLGAFLNSVDIVALEQSQVETFKGKCAYFASVMESMTVNICLFCASVAMETIVFSVWIYDFDEAAAILQLLISLVALVIFGSKILFSILAYGPARYLISWVCYFEICIVLLDLVAVITSIGTLDSPTTEKAILYFSFFSAFIVVHGARIFHIFHSTARPPPTATSGVESFDGIVDKIHNIKGIWVSRYFSNMSFAALDLVNTLAGLPPVFSLELYGTREDKTAKSDSLRHVAHAGRPDWENICLEAINKAHATNPEGESVGIFFCGSPAIARVLQRTAQQVTAQHQRATAKSNGKPCHCRLLVHKENF